MEEDFKPTELDTAIHQAFDQIIECDKINEPIMYIYLDGFVSQKLLNNKIAGVVADELKRLELVTSRGNECVYGRLGLSIKNKPKRYIGYLTEIHKKEWANFNSQQIAKKTNITSMTVAITTGFLAIVTTCALLYQIKLQKDQTEDKKGMELLQEALYRSQSNRDSLQSKMLFLNIENSKLLRKYDSLLIQKQLASKK